MITITLTKSRTVLKRRLWEVELLVVQFGRARRQHFAFGQRKAVDLDVRRRRNDDDERDDGGRRGTPATREPREQAKSFRH